MSKRKLFLFFFATFLVGARFFWQRRRFSRLYQIISLNKEIVTFEAEVINYPSNLSIQRKLVVKPFDKRFPFKILFTSDIATPLYYGDTISFSGRLAVPPKFEDFSYKDYLATRGILAVGRSTQISKVASSRSIFTALTKGRERFALKLRQIYPRRVALLTLGMLLGIDSGFPRDFKEQLREAGLLHLVVVSGGNLVFILTLFYHSLLFFRFNRWIALFIGGAFLLAYSFVVGFSPPVVRALLMTLISLFAHTSERRAVSFQLLLFVAFAMIFVNPYLLLSASFQLSIMATFGLVVILPRLSAFLRSRGALSFLTEAGAVTVSAQLAVLPVSLFTFGKVNIVKSVLTNILVSFVPAMVSYLGLLSGILGFIWLPLGRLVGWFNYLLLRYFLFVVDVFS